MKRFGKATAGVCRGSACAAMVLAGSLALAAPAPGAFPGHNGAIAWTGRIDDRPGGFTDLGLFHGDSGTGALPMGKCEDNGVVGYSVCTIYEGLSFSADGTRVAVVRVDLPGEGMGAASRLVIGDGGGMPTVLPALTSGDADPAWSSNDAKLVFTGDLTASGTGLGRIYTVAPDGSQLRRLTSTRNSREPRWSPNGRYVAFLRYAGRRADLWIMRADGRHAHRLVQDVGNPVFPSQSSSPSWSPRSTAIAFGHRGAIYTIGPDGRHPRRVTPSRSFAAASTPAWSPNGVRIAFVGKRRPSASHLPAIWTIDPSGSHPHRLRYLDNGGEQWSLFALDWQPVPSS